MEDTVSSHTKGVNTTDTNFSTPDMPSEYFSAYFIATRLGISSPKVMLKNASTTVITTMHTVSMTPRADSGTPAFMMAAARGSAK